jgi:hypothetical protein
MLTFYLAMGQIVPYSRLPRYSSHISLAYKLWAILWPESIPEDIFTNDAFINRAIVVLPHIRFFLAIVYTILLLHTSPKLWLSHTFGGVICYYIHGL